MLSEDLACAPAMEEVCALNRQLCRWLVKTPVLRCGNLEAALGHRGEIWGKLEFLQQTGTFKPRGALAVVLSLNDAERQAGITAVSAGNHAIAAAFAAQVVGVSAKVVMLRAASPVRVAACKAYGAEVVLCDTVHEAFACVEDIQKSEGRFFVHPFEGKKVATGTATVGLEICEQIKDFDVVICPIGGGGLCAGIASAVKTLNPRCTVIGVEPAGANSMQLSFASSRAERIEHVSTIADSLGAPFAMPYSYSLCKQFVDELAIVSDEELRQAMQILFREMKFAVEPACAAATAALAGPLRNRFREQRVVLVFCGSNIDHTTYLQQAQLQQC